MQKICAFIKRVSISINAGLAFSILFGLISVFFPDGYMTLHAEESSTSAMIALPGEPCRVKAHNSWTKQEQWTWKQVCEGKNADFNKAEGYGGELEPNVLENWPVSRQLKPKFLETILLYEPYRSAIPRQGVRIMGAWFIEPIDLYGAKIVHEFWVDKSRFDESVDLSNLKSSSLLSLEDSTLFKDVKLTRSEIGGLLNLNGSTFEGDLDMNSLQVANSLLMDNGAKFKGVDLNSAKIGGQLVMVGST